LRYDWRNYYVDPGNDAKATHMTIDAQVLWAEQHIEIGRILEDQADEIIDLWARRAAEEQPDAKRVHEKVLRDHLPKFLQSMGQALADSTNPIAAPLCACAAEHGEQRWENGWSLTEVVRDYQILRLVLFEHLEDELQRSLIRHEVQAIGLALDEAIAASIAAYVRNRDAAQAQMEQTLRDQADELREADRRKNEFMAVLAHELRNPLAPILTAVEVLKLLGAADANIQKAHVIVERQVKQMVHLVDDLLDLTRIAQGKIELRRTMFDVATAVAEAITTTAPLFEAQQHHLSVSLPTEPLPIEGDQARIVQVLVNLLTNAAKFTDKSGRVLLTAAREGGEVVLTVADNGVGIEQEMLGRIFNLFTQVDRSRERSRGGLGIGLTLVRQLVELHGGRVAVHSEGLGRGCEFTLRLPAAAAPPDPAAAIQARPAASPVSILIIEDNTDARTTLQQLLTLLGHRVETAVNGVQGVEAALAGRPRIALIDLGLPGVDGLEVARQVRAGLGDAVRLIALTGHASVEDRRGALDAGFDAHLAKPVDLEALNRLLAEAAKRQTPP
jgi:signal transduction histidine kinase/ActR/RegA family two-component response regulator